MSAEAWAALVIAAVLYAVQFGVLMGRLAAVRDTLGKLERDVENLRDNHVHHLETSVMAVRAKVASIVRHLKRLPCDDTQRRLTVLERACKPEEQSK